MHGCKDNRNAAARDGRIYGVVGDVQRRFVLAGAGWHPSVSFFRFGIETRLGNVPLVRNRNHNSCLVGRNDFKAATYWLAVCLRAAIDNFSDSWVTVAGNLYWRKHCVAQAIQTG